MARSVAMGSLVKKFLHISQSMNARLRKNFEGAHHPAFGGTRQLCAQEHKSGLGARNRHPSRPHSRGNCLRARVACGEGGYELSWGAAQVLSKVHQTLGNLQCRCLSHSVSVPNSHDDVLLPCTACCPSSQLPGSKKRIAQFAVKQRQLAS